MSRLSTALALAACLAPAPAFAQFGGMGGGGGGMMTQRPNPDWPEQDWSVKVETTGGKALCGVLRLGEVVVSCEFGTYHVKAEHLKSVRFPTPVKGRQVIAIPGGIQVDGGVSTDSGGEIVGTVFVQSWTVRTDLGQIDLNPAQLASVTFLGKAEPAHGKASKEPAGKEPAGKDGSKP